MKWFAALLLAASLVAGGCGPDQPEADFVLVSLNEHNFLDPQKISWLHDLRIAECLFEPLLRLDPKDMSIRPGAAERWQNSDDGLTYTFYLRRDAKWSNGDPVTTGDFIYGWRRALLPDMSADYTQLLFCIRGARAFYDWRQQQLDGYVPGKGGAQSLWREAREHFTSTVGIEARDEHTLVVRLARPTPYFLELVAFVTFMPVLRASVGATATLNSDTGMREEDPTYWTDPARLVSNGPYVLKRRRFKRDLLMVANAHHWNRAAMKNTSILERIMPEIQTALLAYENGDVDWVNVPSRSEVAADLVAQDRPDVHKQAMAGVYFYNFNCLEHLPDGSANPLFDRRVRQALSMAIDRKMLVEQVTRIKEPIARTFVPSGALEQYDPPIEAGIEFDPERARSLLAEAGYAEGKELKGLSIFYNTGSGHEKIAQSVKRMWRHHVGVEVTLEGVESRTFSKRLKDHQFTICRAGWFGDYLDPTTWLDKMATNNGNNDCAYSNPRYDALLSRAAEETRPEERYGILRQAEAMMLEDAPMALIHQYTNIDLYRPHQVTGLTANAWSRWRLDAVAVNRGGEVAGRGSGE